MRRKPEEKVFDIDAWTPRTGLGKMVKAGKISTIDEAIESGYKILEAEIVDALIPNLQTDLLMIGQAKGKFGGGQRRVFKQTQKKTNEGNKPSFSTIAIIGNGDGFVGMGRGKARETVPAREKALRNAKRNIIRIRRGGGSWESAPDDNSIPFAVKGKIGSVQVKLIPAPAGTGLKTERECQKILKLAGIKDIWSQTKGHTKTKSNLVKACFLALQQLSEVKIRPEHVEQLAIVEGSKKVKTNE